MNMRLARSEFKYAIRQCRRDEEAMRAEAMSRDLRAGDSRAFWRRVAGGGSRTLPDRIDGAVGEENVANLWACKFKDTLNSLNDVNMKMEFMQKFNDYENVMLEPVSFNEVSQICKSLKGNKAVGLDHIPNEVYINSPPQFVIFITAMISQFLNHSFAPDTVTKAKIIPLLKNKLLDFTSSNNYRPITIFVVHIENNRKGDT